MLIELGIPEFLRVENRAKPYGGTMPKPKLEPRRDLEKESAAAAALKEQIKAVLGEAQTDAVTLADMIEGETDLFEAIDAVLRQIGEDNARIEGIAKFETTLAARKKRLETRVETLRAMLTNALDILEAKKFERPIATVTLKGVPPKLNVTDEAAIPSRFFVIPEPALSKQLLTEELKTRAAAIEDGLKMLDALHDTDNLDDAMLAERKEALLLDHPPIPGAELDNGSVTVQIRFS